MTTPTAAPSPVKSQFSPARNMTPEQVSAKIEQSRKAAAQWKRYSLTQRVDIVRSLWKEIHSRKKEMASVVHEETGKPFIEIETMEVSTAQLILKYFTSHAHRILQNQAAWRPWLMLNKRTYVRYTPKGVIGLITPWNLPFMIPLGDSIPALLAGNGVIVKPSEWTTNTALWLEETIKNTGLLPEGLFGVCVGDGSVGKQVIDAVDMILFTGSTRTGKLVAQAAAAQLKPAVLELGGKHPMIVFKDANLERAAKAAVWGSFANCGQLCVGVERVYVEAEAYDRFVENVRFEMGKIRQGLSGEDVEMGRLIFPPQLGHVQSHLEDARAKGARVVGGEIIDAEKLMMKPALVLNATHDMKVMTEETFGPVMPVMKVARGEDAIRLSNEGHSGLAASVWTSDLAKAERLSASVEAGMIGINDLMCHYAVCSLPFGGVKQSGVGRRHSDEGLRMFCNQQAVLVHEWPASQPELWWFPYENFKTRVLSWLARFT
jgi:acyl-CoA reductase-like NAD-dependent aldehyde dehydrogenase